MMRMLIHNLAFVALLISPALAQDKPTPASDAVSTGLSNNAINPKGNVTSTVNASGTVDVVKPPALEQGANSFTAGQAKARIESAGFTGVTDLQKDQHGIWRGRATRNGQSIDVGFDYKGTIGTR